MRPVRFLNYIFKYACFSDELTFNFTLVENNDDFSKCSLHRFHFLFEFFEDFERFLQHLEILVGFMIFSLK